MVSLLVECLTIQIQIMIRMWHFMQSCSTCNTISLEIFFHLVLRCGGSNMPKSFNYILAHFKADATTFYDIAQICFHDLPKTTTEEGWVRKC